MTEEHLDKILQIKKPRLIAGIHILNRLIPLSHIETNDWENNLYPGVYVCNKENPYKTRRYRRFSSFDLHNAFKFYLKRG